jgi:hypothetical protein
VSVKLKLPYGLRDGQLIHIGDAINGLACDCQCPGCGAQLVAKNGAANQKVAHFAHHKSAECSTGLQTALHLAAKDIIAGHKQLRLPGASGHFSFTENFWASFDFDARRYADNLFSSVGYVESYGYLPSDYTLASRYHLPSQVIALNEVVLEKRTGDIIPDIMVRVGEKWLLVEVAVTHFVDAEKLARIKALGVPALEIDLSNIRRDLSLPELEELIVGGEKGKKWLHNPALRAVLIQRRQQFFALCRPELERYHAEHMQQEARAAARLKWKAEQAAKTPEERALAEQRKQEFYRKNYLAVTERGIGRGLEPILHVDYCPKAARIFHDKPYANVEFDCFNCQAFRGYSPDRTAIVCLFNYLTNKGKTNTT